ncbi:MAG: MerR family transcriptional regulator [Frankiaceae bacterium]|nr:MerR family transcriptional regulator [Frankiaceae bacterium]
MAFRHRSRPLQSDRHGGERVADQPGQPDNPIHDGEPAPRATLNLQGTLFDDLPADQRPGAQPAGLGYRGPIALRAAGITYRQLDYWARTGLVEPSVREASGSGTQRLYSFRDILVLKIVKKLLDAGISLQNIRTAISTLGTRETEDLAQITLMSDGTTVYECTSTDEVVDLLQGGQAVFAIAVGRHVRDVEGSLAQLPGERAREGEPGSPAAGEAADELSSRRRRRTTA